MPVLGDVADARVDGVRHAARTDRPAAHGDPPAARCPQTGKGLTDRGVPAGGGTGEPHHLPGPHGQIQRRELPLQRQSFRAQHGLAGRPGTPPHRPRRPRLLPRHRRHQLVLRQPGDRGGQYVPGVTEDGDGVAQLVDLLEVVRDEQEGHALGAQRAELAEEPVDAAGVQPGGRLVEDDQPRPEGQRTGDLHELPLFDAEILDAGGRVDLDAVLGEQSAGLCAQRPPADGALAPEAVEIEVLRDGQLGHRHRLLVDAGDPALPGRGVAPAGSRLGTEGDGAGVRPLHPGQHGHQGGFAGAVAADQRVRLPGAHGQPGAVQGDGRAVAFDDALGRHRGPVLGLHATSSSPAGWPTASCRRRCPW